MKTPKEIIEGDLGSFAGRFGHGKFAIDAARQCTNRKVDFAIEVLEELDGIEREMWDRFETDADRLLALRDGVKVRLKILKQMKADYDKGSGHF